MSLPSSARIGGGWGCGCHKKKFIACYVVVEKGFWISLIWMCCGGFCYTWIMPRVRWIKTSFCCQHIACLYWLGNLFFFSFFLFFRINWRSLLECHLCDGRHSCFCCWYVLFYGNSVLLLSIGTTKLYTGAMHHCFFWLELTMMR